MWVCAGISAVQFFKGLSLISTCGYTASFEPEFNSFCSWLSCILWYKEFREPLSSSGDRVWCESLGQHDGTQKSLSLCFGCSSSSFTPGQRRFWDACYNRPSLIAQLFHLFVSLLCRVSSGAQQQQPAGQMRCFSHCAIHISSNIADPKGRLGPWHLYVTSI